MLLTIRDVGKYWVLLLSVLWHYRWKGLKLVSNHNRSVSLFLIFICFCNIVLNVYVYCFDEAKNITIKLAHIKHCDDKFENRKEGDLFLPAKCSFNPLENQKKTCTDSDIIQDFTFYSIFKFSPEKYISTIWEQFDKTPFYRGKISEKICFNSKGPPFYNVYTIVLRI